MVITPNHAYIGPNRIDLTKDTIYVHPSEKLCDYSVDTDQIYARLEVVENKVNNISGSAARWMYISNATWACPSTGYYTVAAIGGGGGCSRYGAQAANGGTGFLVVDTLYITANTTVQITIGTIGKNVDAGWYGSTAGDGSVSSFGSLLKANGGGGGTLIPSRNQCTNGSGSRTDGYGYDIPALTASSGSRGAGATIENGFNACAGAVVIW